MQRLTGLDSSFLWMETPTSYMHVASLIVADGSTVPGGLTFDRVRSLYEERLDQAPPFRRRLVEVPFGLHHPLWIEDPDFDLDWHLRQITLHDGSRDLAGLCRLAANLVAIPLDRSRPLWELWCIDGLEDDRVGLLTKVHHAAIDGASGEELMVAILDLEPDPAPRPDPEVPWKPDRVPTDTELLAYAGWSLAQQPLRAARAAKRTAGVALRLREQNRRPQITPPPSPFSAPTTSFNGPLTANRSFAAASVSLPAVKAVKNAFGCTVNDVVLTMCAGGLRRYLDERDEHPDGPLVAMVPVSVRTEDQKGTH
ncbi:MAG TPA: wax ester/triacylglycerol synthase family O-acyltransferase, partial [Acidimicrobiales bacterium]|nr:wax ester/triacylglycerol synthase family O-acyltransferase [Acidimicrobiales bacterium]